MTALFKLYLAGGAREVSVYGFFGVCRLYDFFSHGHERREKTIQRCSCCGRLKRLVRYLSSQASDNCLYMVPSPTVLLVPYGVPNTTGLI